MPMTKEEIMRQNARMLLGREPTQEEFARNLAVGQTMVVHPLDAKDMQKQNKKLQDRSFPQPEEPVIPKNKTKQVKKMTHPTVEVDVKIKKQKEYKPW